MAEEENNFQIDIPALAEIEVGKPQSSTITITNVTGFTMKSLIVTSDIPDSELSGIIPDVLQAGENFKMMLTLSPKLWNPDGLTGKVYVEAKKVSR